MKRIFLLLGLCVLLGQAMQARRSHNTDTVYAFGLAGGLTDTVVYMTDVMPLPDAHVQKKTGFLEARSYYSNQLNVFLTQQGLSNRLCVIYFSKDLKKLRKKWLRRHREFVTDPGTRLEDIAPNDFRFKSLGGVAEHTNMSDTENTQTE